MNTVISIENVSKSYQLGVIGTGTFYGDLQRWWAIQRGLPDPHLKIGEKDHGNRQGETLWALNDINFQVQQGEILGIIGRNGAGKSTLLKILSRVTAPTSGKIKIKGRIASLLEVGTGFHPELTGRENTYMNGTILGMTRHEIDRKFDEIVAFSEIEQFLDTPVKRYSSGMYVRLAFAVAAHLEPDTLIVDEVLAVGDAEFQKKCLGKMGDVSKAGRTILFVSHNMAAIRHLCQRGVFLSKGEVIVDGPIETAIGEYLFGVPTAGDAGDLETVIHSLPVDRSFRLESIRLSQAGKPVARHIVNGDALDVEFLYEILEPVTGLRVFFDLRDIEGNILFRSFHDEQNEGIVRSVPGTYVSRVRIPADFLAARQYELFFNGGIYNNRLFFPDGIRLRINVEPTGNQNRAYLTDRVHGKLAPVLAWDTTKLSD